jgi:succinate dehydrogenase/fumarate reductase cytochrome b subunit
MLNRFSPLNWKLQRWTGALLFVLVIYHFLDQHLMIEKTMRDINPALTRVHVTDPVLLNCKWAISVQHVTSTPYILTYALFLLAALYHGLGGIRLFLLDLGWSDRMQKLIFYALAAVGIGFAVLGLHTLIFPNIPEGFNLATACNGVGKLP